MKDRFLRFLPVALLAICGVVPTASAQNTNMYADGGYQGNVWCGGPEGCVATGFYDGSINGVGVGPSRPGGPGMVCDDYFDDTNPGEHWTADGINVAALNSGNIGAQTLFGSLIGMTGYAELAYLVNQMFTTNPNSALQASYSEALWYLTSNGKISWSSIDKTAQTLVTTAQAYVQKYGNSLGQYANLWLYTPNPRGPNEAQEMWGIVRVAEGGAAALYLLLAGFTCFGAMRFRSPRPNIQGKTA